MHPAMAQALAPFAPPQSSVHVQVGDGINDDDLYIVNFYSKQIISHYGCKSTPAALARMQGLTVKPGQALLTGIQARVFGAHQ